MLILTSLLSTALAQQVTEGGAVPGFNVQQFQPSIDAQRMLWTNDTLLAPNKHTSGRFLLSYVNDPIAYENASGERTELVSDLTQLDLLGAHTRGAFRLGLDVPLLLRTSGDITGGETGLGDISAQARWTALDRRADAVGVALALSTTLPTATVDAPLGLSGLGWGIEAIVDKEVGDLLLAANIGHRGQPEVQLENLEWDDQFIGRLGAGYALSDAAGLSGELATAMVYSSIGDGGSPAEVLAGGYRRVARTLMFRGGVGTGLNNAVGTPKLRVVLALGYEPVDDRDSDNDGIYDRVDVCPDAPEDLDAVEDGDGCPEPTLLTVSVVDPSGAPIDGATWALGGRAGGAGDETDLFGGSYPLSATAPGHIPVSRDVQIPDAAQHVVTITMEPAAQPGRLVVLVVDADNQPIPGARWQVQGAGIAEQEAGAAAPLAAGEHSVRVTAEGYLPQRQPLTIAAGAEQTVTVTLAAAQATVRGDRIDLEGSVYFETSRAAIKAESHKLLSDVATILEAHPELLRIRIEGHTDSRGSAAYNKSLSQERAEAVRAHLIALGVAAERLDAIGYGEERPLVGGDSAAAWEKNRRVDFFVEERSDD